MGNDDLGLRVNHRIRLKRSCFIIHCDPVLMCYWISSEICPRFVRWENILDLDGQRSQSLPRISSPVVGNDDLGLWANHRIRQERGLLNCDPPDVLIGSVMSYALGSSVGRIFSTLTVSRVGVNLGAEIISKRWLRRFVCHPSVGPVDCVCNN